MPPRKHFPSTEQVRQLPLQLCMTIPSQWEDRNGHVNVQFYLTLYELGGYQVLDDVEIDEAWLDEQKFGMFDLEHHLSYRSEILVGHEVSTYNRLLQNNGKRFHGMYFIVNDSLDRLACTVEYITAGVDLITRRTAAFPEQLQSGVNLQVGRHRLLDWPAPVCGSLQL